MVYAETSINEHTGLHVIRSDTCAAQSYTDGILRSHAVFKVATIADPFSSMEYNARSRSCTAHIEENMLKLKQYIQRME